MGDEVGAFRHALWQAAITNKYGPAIAVEVGDAHEGTPEIATSGQRIFGSLAEADQMVDLLNNQDGRNIGSTSRLSVKELTQRTLDFYKNQGLWTAFKDGEGAWVVQKNVISEDKYQAMKSAIDQKDDFGRWLK